MTAPRIAVVGIGADGWAGLGEAARAAILAADEVIGSKRQLALLPENAAAARRPLPSPLEPLLVELTSGEHGDVCVLASGDPMLHGIGATLARRIGPERLDVHPHPSAFAHACARLGWPAAEVELVSTVARVLCARGYGPSRFVVMEQLGGAREKIVDSTAAAWGARWADALHAIAIECRAARGTPLHQRSPGLPDDAYGGDGQLTKRHVRAMTLAALQPVPGQLLWDVGAASGSIGIEWLRAEPAARAIGIEARQDRARQARLNAKALGVPELDVRTGEAPAALAGLPEPDAIFIGGGVTTPGLIAACWEALNPGGRLVANVVTLEGEQALFAARATYGGQLARIDVSHAEPLGSFSGWRAQLPVVQWTVIKP